MTGFEFAFALFSLLLGLSVAEILGGFAGMMKLHARERAGIATGVHTGLLVPLLAALVLLNQLSFWMTAYSVREALPFTYLTLFGTLVVVGGFICSRSWSSPTMSSCGPISTTITTSITASSSAACSCSTSPARWWGASIATPG